MRTPKPLAGTVGLLASWLVGWAIYHFMLMGSCSTPPTDGLPPCPPEFVTYFAALFGGIVLSVLATIFGGGAFTFFALFVAIGLGSLFAGQADQSEGQRGFYYLFAACFLATPAIALLALPFAARRKQRVDALVNSGIEAIGTVLAVDDTGVTINQNPRVSARFRVEALHGYPPPFEAEKKMTVSRLAIPRAGDRYPVWIDPADHSRWGVATQVDATAPYGVRRLWSLARTAAAPNGLPRPLPTTDAERLAELARLSELRASGAIDDAEFARRAAELTSAAP